MTNEIKLNQITSPKILFFTKCTYEPTLVPLLIGHSVNVISLGLAQSEPMNWCLMKVSADGGKGREKKETEIEIEMETDRERQKKDQSN